jgi:uncharacterized Zn-finger protein
VTSAVKRMRSAQLSSRINAHTPVTNRMRSVQHASNASTRDVLASVFDTRLTVDGVRSSSCVQCQFCEKRFINTSSLIVHQRTHTGADLHPCTQCDKCFTRRAALNKHHAFHDNSLVPPEEIEQTMRARGLAPPPIMQARVVDIGQGQQQQQQQQQEEESMNHDDDEIVYGDDGDADDQPNEQLQSHPSSTPLAMRSPSMHGIPIASVHSAVVMANSIYAVASALLPTSSTMTTRAAYQFDDELMDEGQMIDHVQQAHDEHDPECDEE